MTQIIIIILFSLRTNNFILLTINFAKSVLANNDIKINIKIIRILMLKPKTPLFKTTKNVSLKLFKSSMRYFCKLHLKICVLNYFFYN